MTERRTIHRWTSDLPQRGTKYARQVQWELTVYGEDPETAQLWSDGQRHWGGRSPVLVEWARMVLAKEER